MITAPFADYLRSLSTIAARRRGSFNAKTEKRVLVSPDAITPMVFMRFLLTRFDRSATEIEKVDMREWHRSQGEIHDELT